MILEGVVTSVDADGRLNVAPMGPIVEPDMARLRLRPFRTSTTYKNLKATGCGVFHVTDDALLIARGALGTLATPPVIAAERVACPRLVDACRWFEFEVESLDDAHERTEIVARVVHTGTIREFFGFNRAKHAVIEAAILATRLHLTGRDDALRQIALLKPAVEKTAGARERQAFAEIEQHVSEWRPGAQSSVVVRTGARLHFGPFASGVTEGRRFGGVGLMIDRPGATVRIEARSDRDAPDLVEADPRTIDSIHRLLTSLRAGRDRADRDDSTHDIARRHAAVRIEFLDEIPRHAGLGSGTQIALAVARGLHALWDESPSVAESAHATGRGLRSGVGLVGFERGGLLIDAGKPAADRPGTVVARVESPDWPFVLVTPRGAEGLSGARETEAFTALPPMERGLTDRLCRIALLDLAPAFQEGDFAAASSALHEFGEAVGNYFAPIQGGVFAHPAMRELAEHLRRHGVEGVGQTSWGPTLFALTENVASAARLVDELNSLGRWDDCDFRVAHPLNRGARVG